MSRENVEVVRCYLEEVPDAPEQFAAWGDRFWEPDGDYYPPRKLPEARPSHGREEIVRYHRIPCGLGAWPPAACQGREGNRR